VGHETDFTIADFVADLRAPTPSAAAERVVQAKDDLYARVDALHGRLSAALHLRLTRIRGRVAALTSHRVFAAEHGRILNHAQRVDDLVRRSGTALERRGERARTRLVRAGERLAAFRWDRQAAAHRERVRREHDRLAAAARRGLEARRGAFLRLAGKLESLSPLAVLSRGYALVFRDGGRLVRDPADVETGDAVRLRVHGGVLRATVTGKDE
jgi:exodeoxyribonuclease VII large subunit